MASENDTQRTLVAVLIEDRPDALAQTVAFLHRRDLGTDSLVYGASERDGVGRLTLAVDATTHERARLLRELGRLSGVLRAEAVSEAPGLCRELALIKVAAATGQREEILRLAEIFRARAVDVAPDSIGLELTGDPEKIEALLELLRPYGILELARTGPLAMGRGSRVLSAAEHETSWLAHRRRRRMEGGPMAVES